METLSVHEWKVSELFWDRQDGLKTGWNSHESELKVRLQLTCFSCQFGCKIWLLLLSLFQYGDDSSQMTKQSNRKWLQLLSTIPFSFQISFILSVNESTCWIRSLKNGFMSSLEIISIMYTFSYEIVVRKGARSLIKKVPSKDQANYNPQLPT